MRRLVFLFLMLDAAVFAEQKPTIVWSVSDGLEQPESAFYDRHSDAIYISSIAGSAIDKDGKGWITKVSRDGKILEEKWFSELSAPKGIRARSGMLWVTDIDQVVAIDLKTKKKTVYDIKDAKFLNDVAIAEDGSVYISDMLTNKIFRIAKKKVELFVEGKELASPNGLIVVEPNLLVASWGEDIAPDFSTKVLGSLYTINLKTKKRFAVLEPTGNFDGLEKAPRTLQGFFITDWVKGIVYHLAKDSKKPKVFIEGLKNPADIGMVPEKKLLLVPEMGANKVSAYRL